MTLRKKATSSSALCSLALMGALLLPAAAQAGEVNLISSDGTVDIVGEFVEFVDNSYVIRTALGELRLSAERVRCEGADCPEFETNVDGIRIAGSDTVGLGIMPLLMEGYAGFLDAEVTSTSVGAGGTMLASLVGDSGFGDDIGSYRIDSTASGDAFTALQNNEAEIGMASRRIRPAEARALRDAGAGNMVDPNNEHIVAIDSIVAIINPENGVNKLTMQQVAQIYAGTITNWSEIGGRDIPITVVGRQPTSGTSSVFYSAVMGGDRDEWQLSDDIIEAQDNNEAARLVNENEGAIGFVGYAFQRGAKPLNLVNACGLTMTPDAFSARTEEYALQRRLYLYNRIDTLSDMAGEFLDYALSPAADGVIRKAGFIDLGVASRPQPLDGDRARLLLDPTAEAYEAGVMREMLGKMIDSERLSTTFRFRTGSSRLDERGAIDMERLVEYLKDQPVGSKVSFVGFTDNVGAFDSNRDLSLERAQQVMAELQALAGDQLSGIEIAAEGFGEIAPSACNAADNGRAINRRVEVWLQASR